MLVIIKSGGKQYIVKKGDKIKVEKLETEEGKDLNFDKILLVEKNKKTEIGTPLVNGVKVRAKVLKQGKLKKVIVFRYKSKTRYKKKKGHRQPFTEVEIVGIETKNN